MVLKSFKNVRSVKISLEKLKFIKTDDFDEECTAERIRTSKQTVLNWTMVWDSNDSEKRQATKRNTKEKPTIDDLKKLETVTL